MAEVEVSDIITVNSHKNCPRSPSRIIPTSCEFISNALFIPQKGSLKGSDGSDARYNLTGYPKEMFP